MKKYLLLLVLLTNCSLIYSQGKSTYDEFKIPTKDNQPFYEIIDSLGVKGQTKDLIYNSARKAFADLFKDSKEVIEIENREGGYIVGKGILKVKFKIGLGITDEANIKFDINFQAKDSKYRLQFYNFQYKSSSVTDKFSSLDRMLVYAKHYRVNFFNSFHSDQLALLNLFSNKINENLKTIMSDF